MRTEVIGDATLYLGDCLEIMPTLGKVDAVVTDPPYGVMLGEIDNGRARTQNQQPYTKFSDTPEYVTRVSVPMIRYCIERFRRVVATIGARNMHKYPAPDDVGGWWCPGNTSRGAWGFSLLNSPIFYWGKDPRAGKKSYANSVALLNMGASAGAPHPCPKPPPFTRWLVEKASLRGESVLDPMMGSGTTGVACMNLGRKFIGIEIEPKYFDIACKRIDQAQRQGQLFQPEKPDHTQLEI